MGVRTLFELYVRFMCRRFFRTMENAHSLTLFNYENGSLPVRRHFRLRKESARVETVAIRKRCGPTIKETFSFECFKVFILNIAAAYNYGDTKVAK